MQFCTLILFKKFLQESISRRIGILFIITSEQIINNTFSYIDQQMQFVGDIIYFIDAYIIDSIHFLIDE